MPPDILGPTGLLVALVAAVGWLARDHLRADSADRTQRDVAIKGWADHTSATTVTVDELKGIRTEVSGLRHELAELRRELRRER